MRKLAVALALVVSLVPRPAAQVTLPPWTPGTLDLHQIARSVAHMLEGRETQLDYALITHFHPDHMGRITGAEPMSKFGDYRLSGITEVAEEIPIRPLIDRGWPSYAYLPTPSDAMFTNYRQFVGEQIAAQRMMAAAAVAGQRSPESRRYEAAEPPLRSRFGSSRQTTGCGLAEAVSQPCASLP